MTKRPDTRGLLAAYKKRIDDDLLTAGHAPGWDRGVSIATSALSAALQVEGEPSIEAIEQALSHATPGTDDPATRAGFLACEGRIVGFLHGGDAASRALFNLIHLEK